MNKKWLIVIISVLVAGLAVFLICRYVCECRPDTTAPKVTTTALSPDPTNDSTPVLTGMAVDGNSPIDRVEYRVDGGAWIEATFTPDVSDPKTGTYTFITSALAEGEHQVEIRAWDGAGNVTTEGNYATDSFTVDNTAPETNITALTPDPTEDHTPSLSGTATDAISPIDRVEYRVDGGTWIEATFTPDVSDSKTGTYAFTTFTLTDGEHQVNVRAWDDAGNVITEGNYATDSFTVEKPESAFEKIVGQDVSDYRYYQVKITYVGIQLKAMPTLAFSSSHLSLDISRFKPYCRQGVDYSNDDINVLSFTASPEEIKRFIDSIATVPALTTTDTIADPELSLMIMRDTGTDEEQCLEALVGGSDCGVLMLKLHTSLDPSNSSAIELVTLMSKILQVYP